MQTPLPVNTFKTETTQIVSDVFTSMLGMYVVPTEAAWPPCHPVITAAVYFSGSWKGALQITCSTKQTLEFSRRLLSATTLTSRAEDVCDSFGEIANMIGGNLKAILPRTVLLSTPSVLLGSECSLRANKINAHCRQAYRCALGPFWVTLIEFTTDL
jgi:CheY-specific phosphatase CheX